MHGVLMLLLSTAAVVASAAPLERKTLSLALASNLANATNASCRAIGREAVVTVVDSGNNLVALQRGDDVGPHNTPAAQRKTFTALATESSTIILVNRAASDPPSRNLVNIPELLLLGGRQPHSVAGDVTGAIAVAGAGVAASDDRCALEAIVRVLHVSTAHP